MQEASFNFATRRGLLVDFDAAPKGDVTLDRTGGVLGLGIKPRSILVYLTADVDMIITRQPLPRAGRMGVAGTKKFLLDRIRWKVVIAFDDDRALGLRQDRILPDSFHVILSSIGFHAAKFCEHIGVVSLVPVAKARPRQRCIRRPRRALQNEVFAVEKVRRVFAIIRQVRLEPWEAAELAPGPFPAVADKIAHARSVAVFGIDRKRTSLKS